MAGRFCVLGILLLKLQTVFTNPTFIFTERNTNPTSALQNVGTSQAQNILRQNLGAAIANQLHIGPILGQPLGQNDIASLASVQQKNLQSLAQQPLNSAPITISNTAPTRQTITLLDPATTAAFKSFLTSTSGTNGDQTVSLPGQTRLPLSSLPVSFINKCQSTPEVIDVQNQQHGLSNMHSQANVHSLTPLQGQVSLQSLLNVLSNLQNRQATSMVTENAVPTNNPVQNKQQNIMSNQYVVPAILNSPIPNQPQNLVANQNVGPTVYTSLVPNQPQDKVANQNFASLVFNSPVLNQQQNPVASQNAVADLNHAIQNPQQNLMANQNAVPAIFNCPFSNQPQNLVAHQNPVPNQQQNIVANQNGAQNLVPNSPAPNPYAGQSFVPVPQSQPQPLVQSQPALQTNMLYPQGHMPAQQYTPPPPAQPTETPIQAANTNLKKLLPLLFDLVKENECGCQSCNCPYSNNNLNNNKNNYAMQPHVDGSYANQISYGHTDKSEMGENDNEVYESLGSLRDRLKLWKAKTDSSAEKEGSEQRSDTDDKDE